MNEQKRKSKKTSIFFWTFFCIILGFASATLLNPVSWTEAKTSTPSHGAPGSFSQLAKKASPSVVNIRTVKVIKGRGQSPLPFGPNDQFRDFFERFFRDQIPKDFKQRSLGTGFIIDKDGFILTNNHVVEKADEIKVKLSDEREFTAKIVGRDPKTDLALIRIEGASDLTPLSLGDSDKLEVGDWVVAIGNPFGYNGTLTRGVVSGLGRTIPALTTFSIPRAIQTDASINPGNSGGPLLNLDGQVIGVNAQIQTDGFSQSNQGVGFAIPVSIVERVIPALIENGEIEWSWLGVVGGDLTRDIAEAMDLPEQRGAYISSVVERGPADKAGLRGDRGQDTFLGREIPVGGDIIIGINVHPIQSFDDLLNYIALNTFPGQEVTLTLIRGGERMEVTLQLEARPESLQNLIQP